jgi:very-short-patch-repair endonuclease
MLTGLSALHVMGAWMRGRPSRLHVRVPRTAARLRAHDPGDARVHWGPLRDSPQTHALVGLRDALLRVVLDEDLEVSVPCFDWALASGRLNRFDLETVLAALPRSARSFGRWLDPHSQSLLESIARVRLLRRGWHVQSQVRVGDLQSIDLVVERHVALELDGRQHHEARFEQDRRKDLVITTEGRHCIRVSARMLYTEWPAVERAIEAALGARRHGDSGTSGNPIAVPRARKVGPHLGGPFA